MKLLLDTHAFIWWDAEPRKLSARVLGMCQDPANELLVSVGSLWEMQIKVRLGKLRLRRPLRILVQEQQRSGGLAILEVLAAHVFELDDLPAIHRDPFDRILDAQARVEGLRLVTHDPVMREYNVDVIW